MYESTITIWSTGGVTTHAFFSSEVEKELKDGTEETIKDITNAIRDAAPVITCRLSNDRVRRLVPGHIICFDVEYKST